MSTTFRSAGQALVFLSLFMVLVACQQSPVSDMQAAEEALNQAKQAGAEEYASDALKSAEGAFLQAREELDSQDKTFVLLRDYEAARKLLAQARQEAEGAAQKAQEAKERAKSEAIAAVSQARTKLDETRILLAMAPTGKGTRSDIQAMQGDLNAAEMMVTEGQSALDKQDFRGAAAKAQSAQTLTEQVGNQVTRAIEKTKPKKP